MKLPTAWTTGAKKRNILPIYVLNERTMALLPAKINYDTIVIEQSKNISHTTPLKIIKAACYSEWFNY